MRVGSCWLYLPQLSQRLANRSEYIQQIKYIHQMKSQGKSEILFAVAGIARVGGKGNLSNEGTHGRGARWELCLHQAGESLPLWEASPWSSSRPSGGSSPRHTAHGCFCWECWNTWPCIWLFGFPLQMPSIASAVREKNTCCLFNYTPRNTFPHSSLSTPRNGTVTDTHMHELFSTQNILLPWRTHRQKHQKVQGMLRLSQFKNNRGRKWQVR